MLQEDGVEIVRVQGRLDGPRRVIVVSNNNNNGYTGSDNRDSISNNNKIIVIIIIIIAVHLQGINCKSRIVLSTGSSSVIPSQIKDWLRHLHGQVEMQLALGKPKFTCNNW